MQHLGLQQGAQTSTGLGLVLWSWTSQVQIQALWLTSNGPLGKLFLLFGPQFPYLQTEEMDFLEGGFEE